MGFGPVAPLARIPGPEKVGRYSIGLLAKTRATAKGKGARRPAPKPVREIPILPIAVGSVLVLVAIAIVLYSALNPPGPSKGNVRCDTNEQLAYHIHAHLSILNGDQGEVSVPANIGIRDACLYWLHTHDDTGVIHIEAPSDPGCLLASSMKFIDRGVQMTVTDTIAGRWRGGLRALGLLEGAVGLSPLLYFAAPYEDMRLKRP